MKNNISLITDSTCDLPRNYLKQYNIEVVPLTIIWGDEQFRDGVDLEAGDFYERLVSDPVLPTTSQPTPQEMVSAYQKAQSAGGGGNSDHHHQQRHERHLYLCQQGGRADGYPSPCPGLQSKFHESGLAGAGSDDRGS